MSVTVTEGRLRDVGQLALAEVYFLLARDERAGELLTFDQVHGRNLAAAQLAEFVLANQIVASEGRALPMSQSTEREAEAALVADMVTALHQRGLGKPPRAEEYIAIRGPSAVAGRGAGTEDRGCGKGPVGARLSVVPRGAHRRRGARATAGRRRGQGARFADSPAPELASV